MTDTQNDASATDPKTVRIATFNERLERLVGKQVLAQLGAEVGRDMAEKERDWLEEQLAATRAGAEVLKAELAARTNPPPPPRKRVRR